MGWFNFKYKASDRDFHMLFDVLVERLTKDKLSFLQYRHSRFGLVSCRGSEFHNPLVCDSNIVEWMLMSMDYAVVDVLNFCLEVGVFDFLMD